MSNLQLKNETVVGVWATIGAWNSGAKVYPLWNHQQIKKPLQQLNADYIISEFDEGDSDGAFIKNNIDLKQQLDLVNDFSIGNYRLQVFKVTP